jgi:heptosyltransferase-2
MDLARKIGIKPTSLDTEIHLSEEEKKNILINKRIIAPNNEIVIGIHASSGNSAPNWKPEEYLNLLNKLKEVPDIKIVITDNNPPKILNNIPGIYYPNKDTSLRDAIINISTIDLLISASTGPMHIAAALKVKTISLFCPLTACSPELWGPLGNDNEILLPEEEYCKNKCPGDPKICSFTGEGGISYLKVFAKVEGKINLLKQNLYSKI